MRRGLTSLLCVLVASTSLVTPAAAEQLAEKPLPTPARPKADRTAALEQRVRDLEARLVAVEAELRRLSQRPPPAPAVRPELDPARAYAIPLDDSPAIGPRVAPVTLVAVVQFPEPFTAKVWPALQQLRGEYKNQLRTVFKLFVVHPKMEKSSLAVCAAGYQGQLDRMAEGVLAAAQTTEKGEPRGGGYRELPVDELRELARGLRLDLKQYDRDLATCQAGLTRDRTLMEARGQRGVPMFWINGRPLSGARPIENFRTVIDEELVKAKADQAQGGKLSDYYERLIKSAPTAP